MKSYKSSSCNKVLLIALLFIFIEIIDFILDIYDTKDILVKLNVSEILSHLGNSFWNSKLIFNHKLF